MTTPVQERPETPRGPMPAKALKIGIGLLGCVIVLLVMTALINSCTSAPPDKRGGTTGGRAEAVVSTPPAVPPSRPTPTSVDVGRPSLKRPEADPGRPSELMGPSAPAVDPLVEERKKRDFESRYASSVVLSFRGDDGTKRPSGTASAPTADRRGGFGLPSTDEIVDRVMKAYNATNGNTSLPGTVPSSTPPGVTERTTSGRMDAGRGEPHTPDTTPPIDDSGPMHRVLESSIIDAVLVNRLDGSNASPIIGKVTSPLYSHDGAYVLIPADTKIVGETKAVQQLGETRLVVLFHRLIFPNGSTKSLDQFKGLHEAGAVGLKDQVDHHYLSTFGAAAAISVVTGAGQALGNRGLGGSRSGPTVIVGNAGDGAGQATSQVLNRFLNRLPTITIREGARFKVYVTDDIELPAYPSTR